MSLGNIVDKLHDKHCLSYAGTTEESDFSSFEIRLQKVNDLDTRGEHLLCRGEFFVLGGFTMDGISILL